MAIAWPYGIPPDPHLYAYLAAAAASYPYGFAASSQLAAQSASLTALQQQHQSQTLTPHTPPLPSAFQIPTSSPLSTSEILIKAEHQKQQLHQHQQELQKQQHQQLLSQRPDLLTSQRPDLLTSMSFHKPRLGDSVSGHPSLPSPHSGLLPGAVFPPLSLGVDSSSLSLHRSLPTDQTLLPPLSLSSKPCYCPAIPGLHPVSAHLASGLSAKTEVR